MRGGLVRQMGKQKRHSAVGDQGGGDAFKAAILRCAQDDNVPIRIAIGACRIQTWLF
jgi:hypothetical protein